MSIPFQLTSPFQPAGDQPRAIAQLSAGVRAGKPFQTLLGATGTGKTFTMANVIQETQRPALIMSHNKTLAAQLYEEMKALFPKNAVSYFVSYYDYYQPEAYIPQRDMYIEKDASRNADLDRLRLAATSNLMQRADTIVVASVSCIYGLGSPDEYANKTTLVTRGAPIDRRGFLLAIHAMQYRRNDVAPQRGCYRVRGECIEVWPAHEQCAIRFEIIDDVVVRIERFDSVSGEVLSEEERAFVFPAVHYMMPREQLDRAIESIRVEMNQHVALLQSQGKLLEAQRLLGRSRWDLELLKETGVCPGIENYARHMEGRGPGSRSFCLLDYYRHIPSREPADWLIFIDESHVSIPQIRGMYFGDRRRKETLIEHGFRLPSALDNRPLMFSEWEAIIPQCIFVSATPAQYEIEKSMGERVEQVIRPTGLVDPPVEVRGARDQIPNLLDEIRAVASRHQRVLVTALTKRLCEELTDYLHNKGVRVRYLHSDIETLERLEILSDLRDGVFDVLVGVNLLREGLDLPEVALVAILDADQQGFLRSESSLIQTMGRAARNADARCILYADRVTAQMQSAIDEVNRRRAVQLAHNEAFGITPRTIIKENRRALEGEVVADRASRGKGTPPRAIPRQALVDELEAEMLEAAEALEFERAAKLRDELNRVRASTDEVQTRIDPAKSPAKHQNEGRTKPPGSAGSKAKRRSKR
ncbi:MAG: excinuclease ABC subunit UvrB [Phycisphaerales bacterium]|nr:excinuclease ABC subunit UvrB [Phycisphaerales bacterium]